MESPLYFDHAATAPPLEEALDAFTHAAREAFANPGSLHAAGAVAARVLEQARGDLQRALGAERYRVVWVGTGTEANHLGIQGLARTRRRKAERGSETGRARVLYGAVEHPSASEAAKALEAEGFTVESVPVDSDGIVRPDALAARLGADVALVTVQWANNELGSLNPVAELSGLVRNLAPAACFHVDAVQAAGKRPEALDSLGVDAIAVAAHKIGGVRGCAALLLRDDAPEPVPSFVGGGHEGGLRSGTENVAGAAAFAAAAAVRRARLQEDPQRYMRRRAALLERLRGIVPELVVAGADRETETLGSILTVAIPGARAEPLLHQLEAEGVYVGSGSACHAHGATESAVLSAIGFPKDLRGAVLRVSLDGSESDERIEAAGAAFERVLAAAR